MQLGWELLFAVLLLPRGDCLHTYWVVVPSLSQTMCVHSGLGVAIGPI